MYSISFILSQDLQRERSGTWCLHKHTSAGLLTLLFMKRLLMVLGLATTDFFTFFLESAPLAPALPANKKEIHSLKKTIYSKFPHTQPQNTHKLCNNTAWMVTFVFFNYIIIQVVVKDLSSILHISCSIWGKRREDKPFINRHPSSHTSPWWTQETDAHHHQQSSHPPVCLEPSSSTAARPPPHTHLWILPPGEHKHLLIITAKTRVPE